MLCLRLGSRRIEHPDLPGAGDLDRATSQGGGKRFRLIQLGSRVILTTWSSSICSGDRNSVLTEFRYLEPRQENSKPVNSMLPAMAHQA